MMDSLKKEKVNYAKDLMVLMITHFTELYD